MEEGEYRRLSTTTVYYDDLVRISQLKRNRSNRQKGEPLKENSAIVVSRALDALERELAQKDSPSVT